ncbi:MAG TPA: prepilin peptidase [Clostridiaceae bacterium]
MIGVFVFIYGLLIGSFLNVCIYRIPREESIAFPPSHCMNCNNKIKAYDLIPVFSYLFLKGKCRHCGEKISIRYPIIELVNALLYLAVYIEYGFSFTFIKYVVFISLIVVIGMIDLDTTDVYLKTTLTGIILGVTFIIIGYFFNLSILDFVLGGILSGGTIALIIILTKGMGWGDFEICLLSGLFLGFKGSICMLLISFVSGGVIGVVLILLGKKSRKDYIPFGPFIALGSIITVLFGQYLISWYIGLLGLS